MKSENFVRIFEKIFNPSNPNPIYSLQKNTDGSIFTEGIYDYVNYLAMYFFSVSFFFAVFYLWYAIFEKILKKEHFLKKSEEDRAFYLSLWSANTHHVIVFSLAIQNFLFPNCGGSGQAFEWFRSEKCFLTADKRFVYVCLFCCGYLTFDYIVQKYFVKETGALAKQTLFHHVIGASGLMLGLSCGFGAPGIGNLTLCCEISTIFMNYRSMFSKEQLSEFLPMVNQILFFIFYTLFRVCLFPYGTYKMFLNIYYAWNKTSNMALGMYIFMLAEYIAMFGLNLYWYKLILKGLFIALGITKKQPKSQKVDMDAKNGPKEE